MSSFEMRRGNNAPRIERHVSIHWEIERIKGGKVRYFADEGTPGEIANRYADLPDVLAATTRATPLVS